MKLCRNPALLSLVLILLLTAGCSTPKGQQAAPKKIHVDAALAQKVIDTAKTVPGVQDATAVVLNRDILAGVRVTGFERLRLKPIRNEVRDKVKDLNQTYSVQVTADKKLFVQLQAMAAQIRAGAFAPAQIQQGIGKIKREMQP